MGTYGVRRKTGLGSQVLDPAAQLQLRELAAEGVAVNAERGGRAGEVAIAAGEHAGDESLLELPLSINVEDAPVDHLADQLLQLFAHGRL